MGTEKILYCTLAMFRRENDQQKSEILLGLKRKDRLFGGYWNGFGGKVEAGDELIPKMIEECEDECGLTPTEWVHHGTLHFRFRDEPYHAICELFEVHAFNGTCVGDSREFERFQWFDKQKLVRDLSPPAALPILPADQFWLRELLEKGIVHREFLYDNRKDLNLLAPAVIPSYYLGPRRAR